MTGFGAFGGLGQQASAAPAPAASPFGKGLSFGLSTAPASSSGAAPTFGAATSVASTAAAPVFGAAPAAQPTAAPFAALAQASTTSAAASIGFGAFGQSAGSTAAPAASPFGGFGAPSGFGQSPSQPAPSQGFSGFGGFGQAPAIAPGFGTPATPGDCDALLSEPADLSSETCQC